MSTNNDIRKAVWGWVIQHCDPVENNVISYYGAGFDPPHVTNKDGVYYRHMSEKKLEQLKNKLVYFIQLSWQNLELPVLVYGTAFCGTFAEEPDQICLVSVKITTNGKDYYMGSKSWVDIPEWFKDALKGVNKTDEVEKYGKVLG